VADDQIQYLRDQYEDLNRQWDQTQVSREAEHRRRLAEMDKNAEGDVRPIFGAGIAALRNQNPVEAYQVYRQIPINRQIARGTMIDNYNSDKAQQLADLREKVMSRMNTATAAKDAATAAQSNPYHFMPMQGSVYVGNKGTGQMAVIASDKVNEWNQLFKTFYKTYEGQGGLTVNEASRRAFEATAERMGTITQSAQNFGGVANALAGDPVPSAPVVAPSIGGVPPDSVAPVEPTRLSDSHEAVKELVNVEKELAAFKKRNHQPGIKAMEEQAAILRAIIENKGPTSPPAYAGTDRMNASLDKMAKGTGIPDAIGETPGSILAPTPTGVTTPRAVVAQVTGDTFIPTPAQSGMRETRFKQYADENAADTAAISALRNQAPSINVMKSVLSNPNFSIMSGPLHEQLVSVAGFMNYIDPNSKIVKVGDTVPVYFSNMMDLVRDKIKALGAGTAVSNLDLIVTQKSVGDLRNTPEGNKRLLAIMELQNATLNDRLQRKVGFYEGNKNGYEGYEKFAKGFGNEPSHAVIRNENTGNYRIMSKDEWKPLGTAALKREFAKRNKNIEITPKMLDDYWKIEADHSVAKMLKGTGVTYQGKENPYSVKVMSGVEK
jgi:virulence-associated protein VapD